VKVEEVIGMILRYAKYISERQAAGSVKDCVVTIPSFFSMNQRKMLHQSIKISGLNAISFVNENTAAAVYYTIDRGEYNQTHTVLFYNLGSTGIQATLVEYAMTNFTSMTTK
jgi:molecular chaperone DnaK (HSP70)